MQRLQDMVLAKPLINSRLDMVRQTIRPGSTRSSPFEGAIHHTYTYQGWRIRAAFVPPDGPAVQWSI